MNNSQSSASGQFAKQYNRHFRTSFTSNMLRGTGLFFVVIGGCTMVCPGMLKFYKAKIFGKTEE